MTLVSFIKLNICGLIHKLLFFFAQFFKYRSHFTKRHTCLEVFQQFWNTELILCGRWRRTAVIPTEAAVKRRTRSASASNGDTGSSNKNKNLEFTPKKNNAHKVYKVYKPLHVRGFSSVQFEPPLPDCPVHFLHHHTAVEPEPVIMVILPPRAAHTGCARCVMEKKTKGRRRQRI